MEFVRFKKLFHPCLTKNQKQKQKKETQITCMKYSQESQIILAGMNDGRLLKYMRKGFDQSDITQSKDHDSEVTDEKSSHKGDIRCMIYEKIFNNMYVITGSSDRTIKIWENDPILKVVQTLVGHGGSIMSIQYSKQLDTLFSCSNDKSLIIWKQEQGRNLCFHPWFMNFQVIYDFSPKKTLENPVYMSALHVKVQDLQNIHIFGGDSEGSVHIFKPKNIWEYNTTFSLDKTNYQFHRLLITQIMSIQKENMIFTISFDQKIQCFDEISGKKVFSYQNPNKCMFTHMTYSQLTQELIACDEIGRVYFMNALTDQKVISYELYNEKIVQIQILEQSSQLIVATQTKIDILKIIRGLKKGPIVEGHTGPIINIKVLEPFKTKLKVVDDSLFVTASLDNTLRVWDPKDMSCSNVLSNENNAEITCLGYLPLSNLFVTGHENGDLRLWNIDTHQNILLDQKKSEMRHTNTICAVAPAEISRITGSCQEITEYLYSAGMDGRILIWEVSERKSTDVNSTGALIQPKLRYSFFPNQSQTKDEIGKELLCIIFHPGTNLIISGGNSCEIYLVEASKYENAGQLRYQEGPMKILSKSSHADSINALAVDQNFLFSASDDQSIKIWDLVNKFQVFSIDQAHSSAVRDIFIIEETGNLVSYCEAGEVTIWNYLTQERIKTFIKKDSQFRSINYIFSERLLLVGTEENELVYFDIQDVLGIEQPKLSYQNSDSRIDDDNHDNSQSTVTEEVYEDNQSVITDNDI